MTFNSKLMRIPKLGNIPRHQTGNRFQLQRTDDDDGAIKRQSLHERQHLRQGFMPKGMDQQLVRRWTRSNDDSLPSRASAGRYEAEFHRPPRLQNLQRERLSFIVGLFKGQ